MRIRGEFLADPKRHLILVDHLWKGRPIDAEVGDVIITPQGSKIEGQALSHIQTTCDGEVFEAARPGCCRVTCGASNWASFARISRRFFVGRSIYRHLEEVENHEHQAN